MHITEIYEHEQISASFWARPQGVPALSSLVDALRGGLPQGGRRYPLTWQPGVRG